MKTPTTPITQTTLAVDAVDADAPCLGDLVLALAAMDYGTPLLLRSLGRQGHAEALAGNPGGADWHVENRATAEGGSVAPRDVLITRAFFLRMPVDRDDLARVLGTSLVDDLFTAGVLSAAPDTAGPTAVRSQVDVRPVAHGAHRPDGSETLVVSDPDASLEARVPRADHVPGVGQAPLTLLNQIPSTPAGRLLDLGTGSGVLAMVLDADETVATDIHHRALGFARASQRSVADRTIDWRQGSWFEPVSGEEFDRIVSNPPFVVGPPLDGQIYRDSGLDLDDATRTVVQGAVKHLSPGGTAHMLGAWATSLAESAASRVAGWIPAEGIRAWIVQRDEVTPSFYVRTWTADASVDLRTEAGQAQVRRWLDYLSSRDIARIGMGYVHLQRIDGPSEVTFEVVDSPDLGYFGDEVAEYFTRAEWLAHQDAEDILDSRFQLRPGLARENVGLAQSGTAGDEGTDPRTDPGFRPETIRITRTDGPGFSHDIDEALSSVLAGLAPHGLSLRDVAGLYCAVNDLDDDEFTRALVPLIVDLVRHGMVLPTALLEDAR
jgi:methylase of polypeptide subunit release factors